jgi:hypothetical protein
LVCHLRTSSEFHPRLSHSTTIAEMSGINPVAQVGNPTLTRHLNGHEIDRAPGPHNRTVLSSEEGPGRQRCQSGDPADAVVGLGAGRRFPEGALRFWTPHARASWV